MSRALAPRGADRSTRRASRIAARCRRSTGTSLRSGWLRDEVPGVFVRYKTLLAACHDALVLRECTVHFTAQPPGPHECSRTSPRPRRR
jgi:hypothetical protein